MKWIGQHIYDQISRFRNDVIINSSGTHLKLEANADPTTDYATFTVADTGDLTIETVGDGTTDSDMALTADGKITLTPANIEGTAIHLDANAAINNGVVIDAGILDINVTTDTAFDSGGSVAFTGVGVAIGAGSGELDLTTTGTMDINSAALDIDTSGAITIDAVGVASHIAVTTAHTSGAAFHLDANAHFASEVIIDAGILDLNVTGVTNLDTTTLNLASAGGLMIHDSTASSATEGGTLVLASDDGATMASGHRLGVIEFKGAEDSTGGGHGVQIGARIEALTAGTWGSSENKANLLFYTTDGTTESEVLKLDSDKLATFAGGVNSNRQNKIINTTTSSATEGGMLNLISDDGAALGDDHRLGRIAFQAAEDGSGTLVQGATIEAYADAAWSDTENGTRLEFYTKDDDSVRELSLTLDSNLLATFAGAVTVTGALTGTLATVSQPNVTTLAGVDSIGTDGDTLTILADQLLMSNTTADTPVIKLLNTTDDDQASQLIFEKLRDDDAVATGQNLGEIWFRGQNSAQESEDYAYMLGEIDVSTDGQESGQLKLGVANHDGGASPGIILTGGSEDNEIDVTVGLGANSVVTIPGDIDLAGDIDVDGTLETDALTIGGTAFGPSVTKQFTYHMFKDDIDTTKIYIGLQEADAEQSTATNKNLPLLAPTAGKLLKVFLRVNSDLSGKTLTWRLETRASSATTFGSPSVIGTQSGAGCTASSMTTYDFTSSLDSGTNAISAGDQVQLSIQSDGATNDHTYLVTCLWEWDLS